MQVPEKLSLIGGSILLASTLVFTLKSQASDILPKVDSGVSSLVNADKSGQSSSDSSQKQQQAQADQTFNSNFQQAQQKGQQTGQWGSAKFYVDNHDTMHVGSGQLSGSYINQFDVNQIKTISLDGNAQAPQESFDLFSTESTTGDLQNIAHLDRLDTSHVTDMTGMFGYDSHLQGLDLSNFDTSNVTNMAYMFESDSSLHQLSLGPNTKFPSYIINDLTGTYQNNGQTLNLDGNAHPGTWIKQ